MTKPDEREAQAGEESLFEDLPLPGPAQVQRVQAREAAKRSHDKPRVLQANRLQIEMRASDLESLLAPEHRARLVWGYVVRQDLSRMFDAVKARGSSAGRAAIDPRILFALWLYATLEGVGSGREVAREASLQQHLSEAGELVRTLKEQAERDPGLAKRREQAARLRAAEEREQRIRKALEQLPEVAAAKKRNGGKEGDARASTTDPDARVMKMGDGGFRPAANVQFATTCAEQVIVGMDVVNVGSDMAQLAPMVEQVHRRLKQAPKEWLVDGGFPSHEQIDAAAPKTSIYAPVPEPRARKDVQGQLVPQDKHAPKLGDSPAVIEWRKRMGTAEAAEIYKQRAATAECVNAQARNRGLLRMPVRGLAKMKSVVGLFVLAHNLLRTAVLAPHLIGWGASRGSTPATAA